jgi:diaminopimelate epimerase
MNGALRFSKGHGTQNDFVLLPDPDGLLDITPQQVATLCDRHAGIGGDGLLRVVRTAAVPEVADQAGAAEWFMDYRNADGSVAEMCGNGVRVFARYLVDEGWHAAGEFGVATRAGVRRVRLDVAGDVTVDMGVPLVTDAGVTVSVDGPLGEWRRASRVDIGNPHAVVFVPDLDAAGDLKAAPLVAPDTVYPEGVNVEFVVDVDDAIPHHIAMRVHERGVGETRSCGTGACAAMAATARRDGAAPATPYTVDVPGGRLVITERADGRVEMTGPAVLVAQGTIADDLAASHHRSPTPARIP